MQESQKLNEARFFLEHLEQQRDDPVKYRYFLSAFLNAGRSVIQYAIEENQIPSPKDKSKRIWKSTVEQNWFHGWSRDRLIAFFRDVRDDNIHIAPVNPEFTRGVMMGSPGAIKMTVSESGRMEVEGFIPSGEMGEPFTFRIEFRNWSGPEDATRLCESYLQRLQNFVNDGVTRGLLKNP